MDTNKHELVDGRDDNMEDFACAAAVFAIRAYQSIIAGYPINRITTLKNALAQEWMFSSIDKIISVAVEIAREELDKEFPK